MLPNASLRIASGMLSSWQRRRWLLSAMGAAGGLALAGWSSLAQALPTRALVFPRDFGSHPELRTEWWYVTGEAFSGARRFGFQVTFFRSRIDAAASITSAFGARQLVFAHAALTDVSASRLRHDQRIARQGFGIADAQQADTAIRLRDWSLVRRPATATSSARSRYVADIAAADFRLALTFDPTQPLLLQGNAGLSRKGPDASQASYYYSEPQLAVSGHIEIDGKTFPIDEIASAVAPAGARTDRGPSPRSVAWLDHEWSEALLHPDAVGWDWIGMNLNDGSALTAFRLRRVDGSQLWAGGSWRAPTDPAARIFSTPEVRFEPQRHWISPHTSTRYPVEWRVSTPFGRFTVRAVLPDQELDSRGSTGSVYWEGLSDLLDEQGSVVGRGYLEMTGYANRLQL